MKIIILAVATAALFGWGVVPAFHQKVESANRATPERNRLLRERDLRMGRALAALKDGNPARRAEVRDALADLEPNDRHRPPFAAALAARGEVVAAYKSNADPRPLQRVRPAVRSGDGVLRGPCREGGPPRGGGLGAGSHGRGRALPGVDAGRA